VADEKLAGSLRKWAAADNSRTAAVDLLVWHDYWIRRADFIKACTRKVGGVTVIRWEDARTFAEARPGCSTSELNVLRLAIAIGADDFGVSGFGRVHRRRAAEAFAAACGWQLEGDIPEQGHSHPDFIPGTPETCTRCAIDAGDEGRGNSG
jgi:hypothetical protein